MGAFCSVRHPSSYKFVTDARRSRLLDYFRGPPVKETVPLKTKQKDKNGPIKPAVHT